MKTGVKWRGFFGAVMLGGMLCACGGETPGAAAPEPQETAAEPAQTQEAAAVTEAERRSGRITPFAPNAAAERMTAPRFCGESTVSMVLPVISARIWQVTSLRAPPPTKRIVSLVLTFFSEVSINQRIWKQTPSITERISSVLPVSRLILKNIPLEFGSSNGQRLP